MKTSKYETKSVIIGRKPNLDEELVCFVSLFDVNDPHKKNLLPKQMLEFSDVHKVIMKNIELNYMIEGSDVIINNLKEIEFHEDGMGHLIVNAKQE